MLNDSNCMRKLTICMLFSLVFMMVGCWDSKPISETELYGNSFIHIDSKDFNAPDNWKTLSLFDSAFQIKLPPYMRQTESFPMNEGCSSVIFMYRDTTKNGEYHYGRVGIDYYYHGVGDFNKADEYISYSDQERVLEPVVKKALSGGKQMLDYTVPDGELLNGPFYDSHHIYDRKFFYAYDAYYRRKGHTGEGPVSCHIFFLMNRTEAALMTVSYHDPDSVLFKDLFNLVKTFKWTTIHE